MEQSDFHGLESRPQDPLDAVKAALLDTVLNTLVRAKVTLSYGEVAKLSGFDQAKSSNFHQAIKRTVLEDARRGAPIRAAAVVLKRSRVPGDDYFRTLVSLGLKDAAEDDMLFHEEQLSGLFGPADE